MQLRSMITMSLLLLSSIRLHAGNCSVQRKSINVNRHRYEALQKWVNQGHEPWRLDSPAVAGEVIARAEKNSEHQNVYAVGLKAAYEGQRKAVYRFDSQLKPGVSYSVTLRRFAWMLPISKRWEWTVWSPTELIVTKCSDREDQTAPF